MSSEQARKVGYARVEPRSADEDRERAYLVEGGCTVGVYVDDLDGEARTGVLQALAVTQPGDVMVARNLFRLAPTFSRAQELVDALHAGRAALMLGAKTYGPDELPTLSTSLGMSADFERHRASIRVRRGVRRAKADGGGRAAKLSEAQQRGLVESYRTGRHTVAELAAVYRIGKSTAYRIIEQADSVVKQPPVPMTPAPDLEAAGSFVEIWEVKLPR